MAMAHLRLTSGPAAGTRYSLDRPKTVVGRHPSCDIATELSAVSRYHAQFVQQNSGFVVEDLQSRNGTYVNEQRVDGPRQLQCDDVIRICDLIFVFHDEVTQGQLLSSNRAGSSAMFVEDKNPQSSIRRTMDMSSKLSCVSVSAEVKLQALIDMAANLSRSVGFDAVLPKVLETLFTIFPQVDRGFIVFRDGDGVLIPKSAKFREAYNQSARISRTIINYAIDHRQAIISADAGEDERFDMTESIAQIQIRSMMCAPLLAGDDDVLGAVHIDTVDPRAGFDDADLELLVAIVSQAALVVKNAQLYEQALERQAMERDLELARQVQMGLLPQKRPEVPGYRFVDYYRAANLIGGDYYDYVKLPDDRVAVLVADVTGHGPAAALLMTKLAAEARYCLATCDHPADVVCRLNQLLAEDGVEDRFVTLILIVLTPTTGEIAMANAAHMPPLIHRRADGRIEELAPEIGGLPLGVNEDFHYQQATATIQPGDIVTLYTDGISEAMNKNNEQFGFDRLRKRLSVEGSDFSEYANALIDDVRRFTEKQPQSDDICVVCIRRDT